MKTIAVYGTLRKEGIYHDHYFKATDKPLGTQYIQGFDMYSLSNWPCIIKGKGKIFIEVYKVDDDIADRIEAMERRAGYDVIKVPTFNGIAQMFYMSEEELKKKITQGFSGSIVPQGDWIKYKGKS